jgi:hypothetical protein
MEQSLQVRPLSRPPLFKAKRPVLLAYDSSMASSVVCKLYPFAFRFLPDTRVFLVGFEAQAHQGVIMGHGLHIFDVIL